MASPSRGGCGDVLADSLAGQLLKYMKVHIPLCRVAQYFTGNRLLTQIPLLTLAASSLTNDNMSHRGRKRIDGRTKWIGTGRHMLNTTQRRII